MSNAQNIIKSLVDISSELPSEKLLDATINNSNLSLRTAASLHLMLYQVRSSTLENFNANVRKQLRQLS